MSRAGQPQVPLADPGWRAPTGPADILRERREPVGVNLLGSGQHRTVADLNDSERARFDAQMTAWLAGCALILAVDHDRLYGIPVHHDAVTAWWEAIGEHDFERGQRAAHRALTGRHTA